MARYEFSEGTSNKFWEIVMDEDDSSSFTVRWGRIGTEGQETTKSFDDEDEAQREHDKLIVEKTRKGYKPVADVVKALPVRDPNRKTLKINLGIYVRNQGDGSASVSFFRDSGEAEESADGDDERLCDDTYDRTIEVYADTGELVFNDDERERISDAAWDAREEAEKALKSAKTPGMKKLLKGIFDRADAAWQESH